MLRVGVRRLPGTLMTSGGVRLFTRRTESHSIHAAPGTGTPTAPPPFHLVGLTAVIDRTRGSDSVPVAVLDGPVDSRHPAFSDATLRAIGPSELQACSNADSEAWAHGTFTAGILAADRQSPTPGICPASPLLIRPIFTTVTDGRAATTPADVAAAIIDSVNDKAKIINLSAELLDAGGSNAQAILSAALDWAAHHGAIIVAAAGNRAAVAGSLLTQHPWVLPVAACDDRGVPLADSNLGASISRRGVLAPGERIMSLAPGEGTTTLSGTSAATAIVSGAIALAWSLAPAAPAYKVRQAISRAHTRRPSIVPPLLNTPALVASLTASPWSLDV